MLERLDAHRKQNPVHVIRNKWTNNGECKGKPLVFARKNADKQRNDTKGKRKDGTKVKDKTVVFSKNSKKVHFFILGLK